MKEMIGLRPGAAEKVGLELFIEVLEPLLCDFEVDDSFGLRLEAVAGALIQGIFAGIDDVSALVYDAVGGQFTTLSEAQLDSASTTVAAAVGCL